MKIKILPLNIELEADSNRSLMQICHENGIAIKSLCKGIPSCAECRVYIKEGEHNLSPPTRAEQNVLGTNYFLDGRRLSCQVRVFGDVTIDIQEQLDRKDTSSKKVRGFRPESSSETKAVLDTMILKEKK